MSPNGPKMVRQLNRKLVLDQFRDGEPRSRADVARQTGLTKPSATTITDGLLAEGFLVEAGVGEPGAAGGRRPNLLRFNERCRAYVGVHFGAQRTMVTLADALGNPLARASAASSLGDAERGLRAARTLVLRACGRAEMPVDLVAAVGVSVEGMVDRTSGRCLLAPNLGWRDVPIQSRVEELIGAPATVFNEAHAGALAENHAGVAVGVDSFVRLSVGTGVGSGVMLGSRLFSGSTGIAGEIGHCRVEDDGLECGCGNTGCLETVAGERAITSAVDSALRGNRSSSLRAGSHLRLIIEAAHQGDAAARAALARAGRGLARGISYLLNVLDPDLVVIGGAVREAGELLLGPLRAELPLSSLPQHRECQVVFSEVPQAELDGAVLLARRLDEAEAP
ncbi:ROK family protein [Saccharopolyspora flava]|uniref:Sugar kinase of the NBD/HSP70 family, may contain an N-terminal HTH domain n=1 Tax=Saccharopolyspora flava TaxID=95161 RepID=A0A1I6SQD5_9PSEU|nr:ROK family protein [Saccharopolyspora flava]SFS79028.1 Sugar kinase of the NBD/HSP70 family, may contain an N-terminal HTH domain [Saccharopolyspora flava]